MLTDKNFNKLVETVQNMYQPKPVAEASMMKDDGEVVHNCAKHVEHATWGKGNTIAEEHAAPDAEGNIDWYDVEFEHGIEKAVPTADLQILAAESHGHPVKKKAVKEETETIAEGGETTVVDLGSNAAAVKAAADNTKENKATPGAVAGAKEDGEKEIVKQGSSAEGVKEAKEMDKSEKEDEEEDEEDEEDKEVDETIIYKTLEFEIAEAADNYDAHFKAMMKKHGINHPGELDTPEKKKAFFNAVDASYKAKNEEVFLEAASYLDVQDRMKAHEKAGNKVSQYNKTGSGDKQEFSFVVTQPSGKRTRHIYHARGVKVQSMSPAPKSSMAADMDDEDDK